MLYLLDNVDSPNVPSGLVPHSRHSVGSSLVQATSTQPPPPPLPSTAPIGFTELLPSTSSLPTVETPSAQTSSAAPSVATRNRVLDFPAVRFLLRTDFFNLLHLNDEALAQYNTSSTLKAMVTRIRREGLQNPPQTSAFERHQHNRYLVSLINKFAETNKELPPGNAIDLGFL